MFDGPLKIADRCSACGLDLSRYNVGDGAAAFLILVLGVVVVGGAIWLELALGPPWPVHLIWLPILFGLTIRGLRVGKAGLLYQEHAYDAREGGWAR